ncbi:substrate-binding domain-containing protein [Alkaliphilus peptidifermentans]|uniref:Tungstate transport system substrate-binding protein n=1 Tax=Alkaliphilus peptidifermentans DSM 18978 TaxID=1120976 RepID=A0A1G5IZN2_9FIRM|nr:substrate-binding domain-containing protein [Alkaliphilus peptidifermentans]SCY81536.1 tungstate transport system substrate-binding protein [Alkaliphilus peptidifermentans DSM 18978]
MKKKFRQKVYFIFILVFILSLTIACRDEGLVKATGVTGGSSIILSTTTSTENSGLLDFLLPTFTEDTGIEVKVVAVGTGQALKMGEDGDADVLLVHAKSSEEEFIKAGHGLERFNVMYNDYILIGPVNDPLNVKEFASADIAMGLYSIHEHNATFISRGDDSGTHKMELSLWQEIGIEPQGDWYFSVGQGMGQVIQIANEKLAYTLSDRATFLSMLDKIELEIIIEGDNRLFNQYGIIAVNPEKSAKINHSGAQELINWILSEKGQQLIGEFGKDIYGQSLFIPNAEK